MPRGRISGGTCTCAQRLSPERRAPPVQPMVPLSDYTWAGGLQMRNRLLTLIGCLVFVAPVTSPDSGSLAAQTRPISSDISSRAPDRRPDLSGVYDVATITPVERPAEYGNRLVLTDEEAAAMEQYEQERNQKDLEPVDPSRGAPPVGGDTAPTNSFLEELFRAGGGAVGGYNLVWINSGSTAVTIDGQQRTSLIVDPADGRVPPMTTEARQRLTTLLANRASPDAAEGGSGGSSRQFDGPDARPLAERCILGFGSTSGPPTLPNYFYNNLKQIVQTPEWVMIYNEMVHDTRIIRIADTHLPAHIKLWMGDSIGHWEGDTLVVETTNFTNKTRFRGSGEDLKVIEHFTRTDDQTLLYRFTVEDPSTWERPWTGEYPWRASHEPIYEYACHEGNYALPTVLRGARVAEKEAGESR